MLIMYKHNKKKSFKIERLITTIFFSFNLILICEQFLVANMKCGEIEILK